MRPGSRSLRGRSDTSGSELILSGQSDLTPGTRRFSAVQNKPRTSSPSTENDTARCRWYLFPALRRHPVLARHEHPFRSALRRAQNGYRPSPAFARRRGPVVICEPSAATLTHAYAASSARGSQRWQGSAALEFELRSAGCSSFRRLGSSCEPMGRASIQAKRSADAWQHIISRPVLTILGEACRDT
jgi:hypothetical protein